VISARSAVNYGLWNGNWYNNEKTGWISQRAQITTNLSAADSALQTSLNGPKAGAHWPPGRAR